MNHPVAKDTKKKALVRAVAEVSSVTLFEQL